VLKLTQIELLGFKSFPHKTVLDLDDRVNCIVGPNGSGKSNIADAIMFAFGSQSGHELRTGRLAGLIFAGTDMLRALNLASVTLHFVRTAVDLPDEEDTYGLPLSSLESEFEPPLLVLASQPAGSQLLERAGYPGARLTRHVAPEAEEVERTPAWVRQLMELRPGERLSLTRRVFRDGTGGYFLNSEPVRLKDIDALFNRYNLGRASAYSISQGEVEKKILDTPQELREWVAEATGVALLLQQKQRALTKLKRTQGNLERLEDIRAAERELVAELAVQRERAEAHLALASQLRAVELNEIKREVEFSQRQQDQAAAALGEVQAQLAQTKADLDAQRMEHEAHHRQRDAAETEAAEAEQELAAGRERLAALQREAAVAQAAVQAAQQAIAQAATDERSLAEQLAALNAGLEQNAHEQGLAREELAQAGAAEAACRRALEQVQAGLSETAGRQAEQANRAFELGQELARLRNELEAVERHGRQLAGQLEQRQRHLDAALERLAVQEAELDAEQEQAGRLSRETDGLRSELEGHKRALGDLAGQLGAADGECSAARQALAELQARRNAVAELTGAAQAPGTGRACLLGEPGLAGQLGEAAEGTFPDELRPAFTRLLAHLGDALAGAVELREAARGVLLDCGGEALLLSPAGEPALHARSLWRRLSAPAETRAALYAALGDVLPAESITEAEALLDREPSVAAVVLADGSALIGRGYAYLGRPAPEQARRVAQRSDLAGMERAIAQAEETLAAAERRQEELKAGQAQRQWAHDDTAARLAGAAERQRSAAQLCERLARTVEERRAELELLARQLGELARDSGKLAEGRPALEDQLAALLAAQASNDESGWELRAAREQAERAVEQARDAHGAAATASQLAAQRAKHVEQAGFDLAERVNNARARLAQLEARVEALVAEREAAAAGAAQVAQAARELAISLDNAVEQLSTLKTRRSELAQAAEAGQAELTRLAQAVSRLEQDEVSLASQRDRAVERVAGWLEELRQRYGMTLTELLADPNLSASPAGAELDALEAGRGKLREERARLGAALSELGPVNLLAIEQHQQHANRLAFMDAQAAELTRASTDLARLIGELDLTTEQRYRANLRRIEARFNELYLHLFGSGWARLRFETPEALIDSGVEVEVMLTGGRKHNLRSLSGGQRALIFLALFFAVHSVRSPGFCILDEVDAALDDANVERFVKLLQEFARQEQCVVITHNKVTMEIADRLIGVVGRPKGVSNLISVDLKEARRLADQGAA
jgi:chromosome segregation protein